MKTKEEKMKEKNVLVKTILTEKLQELGGKAFARWLAEVKGGETKKTADAADFMMGMLAGEFVIENKEYLEPYLKPMREILEALNTFKDSMSQTKKLRVSQNTDTDKQEDWEKHICPTCGEKHSDIECPEYKFDGMSKTLYDFFYDKVRELIDTTIGNDYHNIGMGSLDYHEKCAVDAFIESFESRLQKLNKLEKPVLD